MATYHGIIRAACLACRYSTIDDHTLTVWNDAPIDGNCPNCHGETGQSQWVLADGRVLVLSFVDGNVVAETNVAEPAAWGHVARAMCERVAALIPGAKSTDDGGGEYVYLDVEAGLELFPCPPDNAPKPEQAGKWMIQRGGGDEVHVSDLDVLADPADVIAWALPIIQPEPEPRLVEAPPIHVLSEMSVVTLAEMLTRADANGKLVRVAWDGGLKVKVAEDCWTPILSHPFQP